MNATELRVYRHKMGRIFLLIIMLVLANSLGAQTRRIAHRVHSGSDHERYDVPIAMGSDGNYGDPYPYPSMIKIHLESGRDTLVEVWDTLARPYYLDTTPRANFHPIDSHPKKDIREMGVITHRLIVKA